LRHADGGRRNISQRLRLVKDFVRPALVIMTAGFMTFCTAALLTELQRIKTVLLMGLPPVE
jgi:hypothetical protein